MDLPEQETAAILYVDDEEMARKYFALAVGEDYAIHTAAGADAAIAILRDKDKPISILVTDYRMPGRDGGDLLRQTAREFPSVVRILITAYADREVLLDTINSGEVFRVLEKPLDLGEVKSVLRLAHKLSRERNTQRQKLMAMNETLAFLGHELNTPLAAIINYARGVQRRVADGEVPPQRQHFESGEMAKAALAIDDNARYCLSLLSSFVASVQSANAALTDYTGSTAQRMISFLLDTYPLSPAQRASIRIDIQEDFRITALPNCVELALSSLLSNALRAIRDQPAPMICFSVLVAEQPQIRIIDNGCGVPPEIQDRLMADPVTAHAAVGAGVSNKGWGLIFCKRIMQSFGGSILIHSAPGTHTSVTLNFPLMKNKTTRSAP